MASPTSSDLPAERMRILAVSGSLRAVSSNTALLKAAAERAPKDVCIMLFDQIEPIPAFNPDREMLEPPLAVTAFRDAIRESDAVLISTPEYAHGVPGALKNALDWIVGSGELYEKPIAFLHASPRGEFARAALKETLVTMGGRFAFDGIADPDDAAALAKSVSEIAAAVAAMPVAQHL